MLAAGSRARSSVWTLTERAPSPQFGERFLPHLATSEQAWVYGVGGEITEQTRPPMAAVFQANLSIYINI